MKNNFIFKISIIIFLLINLLAYSQDNCKDILTGGIYDYSQTNYAKSKSLWYISQLIKENFSSYEQHKNSSFNITVPIEDVMANMGFSRNEEGYQQLRNYLNNYLSFQTKDQEFFDQVLYKINPSIIDAWSKCMQTDGAHFFIEYTSDPNVFNLRGYYRTTSGTPSPKIVSGNIGDKNQVIVESNGPFLSRKGVLKNGINLPLVLSSQQFRRKNNEQINININLSYGGNFSIVIPGLPHNGTEEEKIEYKTDMEKTGIQISPAFGSDFYISKNKIVEVNFRGYLKFHHIGTGGQCRPPAFNNHLIDMNYPTPILEYKISKLKNSNWIDDGVIYKWKGDLLRFFSKDSLRISSCIRLYWVNNKTGILETQNVPVEDENKQISLNTKNCSDINLSVEIITKSKIEQKQNDKTSKAINYNYWIFSIVILILIAVIIFIVMRKKSN